jgi:hypothetical protein
MMVCYTVEGSMSSTLQRILLAAPNMRVDEIVSSNLLNALPKHIRDPFAAMKIVWADNRSWGESFQWGSKSVKVGHRRGDHLAMHPHLFGVDSKDAEAILCVQIEGTILHELGHSLLDRALKRDPKIMRACVSLMNTEGPMSTYVGHDKGMSEVDKAHEAFAEGFRYAVHQDRTLMKKYPGWHELVRVVIALT